MLTLLAAKIYCGRGNHRILAQNAGPLAGRDLEVAELLLPPNTGCKLLNGPAKSGSTNKLCNRG